MSQNNIVTRNGASDLIGKCNGKHSLCHTFCDRYPNPKTNQDLTQEIFHRYIGYLNTSSNYNCCLTSYNNNHCNKIINFVADCCTRFLLGPQWYGYFINHFSDIQLLNTFKNQVQKEPLYVEKMLTTELQTSAGHYNNTQSNFVAILVYNYSAKRESVKYIFNLIPASKFSSVITKVKSSITSSNEPLFVDYIKKNADQLTSQICQSIITSLPYRSNIICELFTIIVNNNCEQKVKLQILSMAVDNIDKNLIMRILETCREIKPDLDLVDSLLKKVYANHSAMGANQSKIIADVIDIFIMYGLKVTRELVIKLLNKTCYVNNIEKYNIKIDEEILLISSNYSYYPYKYDIKPPKAVLIKECGKTNNIDNLKKLKENGGEFDSSCLAEACKNTRNGKVIKFLIQDCGVKSNDECMKVFSEAYHTEALDLVIKGYDSNKNNTNLKVKNYELDPTSTLVIEPRKITIDNSIDYKLKNKIKKFFNYAKKSITYLELFEIMLKYLIEKKLVIGNYFVLNAELASILKLENCNILHIDQLKNIITYFIDPLNE